MTPEPSYGSRPTNGSRRTKAEMDAIRVAIIAVLEEDRPQTVRQVFYRLTSAGVVAKTESEYKQTVVRLLGGMRRSGRIPYGWIADATRSQRKPITHSSMEGALKRTAETYRRALWDDAETAVEIWLEKDALAGVLYGVTGGWDVPLMVCRGYPSISFLHSAAEAIYERDANEQRTAIYYFGDHDPSGVDIDRAIVKGIGESLVALDGGSDDDPEGAFYEVATFERVAVTPHLVRELGLQTRPTKRHKHDYRAKKFKGASVEVDAIPARQLRRMAEGVIERHVDQRQLDVLRTYEQEERRTLFQIAQTVGDDNDDKSKQGDG